MATIEEKFAFHKEQCDKLNPLYIAKNTDYDDSFSKGIDSMGYMSALVRMDDKMNRIKALLTTPANSAKGGDEPVSDTLLDLANYTLMLLTEYELRKDSVDSKT